MGYRLTGYRGCSSALLDRRGGAGRTILAIAVAALLVGLDDGAHPVVAFAVDLDAVGFTFETGEASAELFHGEDERMTGLSGPPSRSPGMDMGMPGG